MVSTDPAGGAELYCSYAHRDERLRHDLERHLSLLQRQGVIRIWHDRQILAGSDRAAEIDAHLNTADVIVLLVSPDFLASDYCFGVELRRALERHAAGEARVIPVILRPVDWRGAPFGHLQALPSNGRPVTRWRNRDEAFADVARGIRVAVQGPGGGFAPPEEAPATSGTVATMAEDAAAAPVWTCSYPPPAPRQLIGREDELARLEAILERGRKTGQVAILGGPAGVGKTALVGELVRRAQQAGVLCMAGGCYEERGFVPLAPFHDAMADYLLAQPPQRLALELGDAASRLADIVPELREHLGLPEAPGAASAEGRMRVRVAVGAWLRRLANRHAILLCLEDLDHADEPTLHLIHYLARNTHRLPVVLLGTYRSDEVRGTHRLLRLLASLAREGLGEHHVLAQLDREQTAALIAALLGGPASHSLADQIYARSEGNPLFVEQLILSLREQDQLQSRAGRWYGTVAAGAIPMIIRAVIGQRIGRLSRRCRDLLALAAVMGRTVEHGVLQAALAPGEGASLLTGIEEALDAQVLRATPTGYAFGHALVWDVVYLGLSPPRRMLLHGRVGETLERLAGPRADEQAPELARHFVQAGSDVAMVRKALHYSLVAGRRAAALAMHGDAYHHFTQAGDLIEQEASGDPAIRLEALVERGRAEQWLGMWRRCVATLRQALQLAADPLQRAQIRDVVTFALHHTGDMLAALAEINAGLAELDAAPAGPDVELQRMRLHYQQTALWFCEGRFTAMIAQGQRMLELAGGLDQPRAVQWAHDVMGAAYMGRGQMGPAVEHFQAALAAAELTGDKVGIADKQGNLGLAHYRAGRFLQARQYLERALDTYRFAGSESRSVPALVALGRVCAAEGDLQGAAEHAELARWLATDVQDRFVADCHDLLGGVHSLRAEWRAAEEQFEQALATRQRVHHAAGTVDSLLGLAQSCEQRGDWPRARELYGQAIAIASGLEPCPQTMAAARCLGLFLLQTGDAPAAALHAERAAALAEDLPETLERAPSLLLLAELRRATGDSAAALRFAEQALTSGCTVEVSVRTQAILAEVHLAAARLDQAGACAVEALHAAQRTGCPHLLGLAHRVRGRVLAATGDVAAALAAFGQALDSFQIARTPRELTLLSRDLGALCASGLDQAEEELARDLLARTDESLRQLGWTHP